MTISIVTPHFRQIRWLGLCRASVQDQRTALSASGGQIEHIIQDGGTEGIDEFRSNVITSSDGYNLVIHAEKDQGMYDAINRGFARSTGEILAWLNSDEQFLPGTLGLVTDFFRKNKDVDVLFGDAILTNDLGEPLSYRRVVRPSLIHTRLCHLCTLSCATFFRRKIVTDGLRLPSEYKAIGDAVFISKILETGYRVELFQKPLSVFTFTGSNLGASNLAEKEAQTWRISSPYPAALKFPAILAHRFKKFFAGAYRKQKVQYSIFTQDSPNCRKEFNVSGILPFWPQKFNNT